MDEERRNPDEILESIKREEMAEKKGRLKIFLGMAAGVGKTYAMLEEAQELKKAGVDVAVGVVNTHSRVETAEMLEGLRVIPEMEVTYKGNSFKELDLDAVLTSRPELVLVDELAHSNIPGLRHEKRWQDVVEILDHGINVYTTLNVQHIESLNDIVKGITEISVRETVPDLIIEKASSIQLIDITPDELLQRLKEGKVYLGDQSRIAVQNFFQKDKLAALREIILRYAAEKVDRDLHKGLPTSAHVFEWKPREKFLVAIGVSPQSQKLIRIARRLAANLKAPWTAIYVDTGKPRSEKDNEQLARNMQLARDLGAEVITAHDSNIVEAIQRTARQKGITRIIIGRSPRGFILFKKSSIVDDLLLKCPDIDIHIVRQEKPVVSFKKSPFLFNFHKELSPYFLAFLFVLLLTIINWFALPYIGYKVIGFIFLLGIISLSFFFKRGPILFASILYAIIWAFLFIPTERQFAFTLNEDTILLAIYVITAMVIGVLVDRAREHKDLLIKSEGLGQVLYDIASKIATAPSMADVFSTIKQKLNRNLSGKCDVIVKSLDHGFIFESSSDFALDEQEKAAAHWVFENGKEAGWSTETLPSSKNFIVPLKGFHEVFGVLCFKPDDPTRYFSPEEKNLLYTVAQLLTGYLERTFADERIKQHEQLKQMERIHKIILDRLSQEFSNPLQKAQEAIKDWKLQISGIGSKKAMQDANQVEDSFDILVKILANISTMAQLSEGMIPLNKSLQDIRELITECCESTKQAQNGHSLALRMDDKLPEISFDFYLIHILLYNLIVNALQYSPINSVVLIEAKALERFLVVSVTNEGRGIPEEDLDMIFEKFYRHPDATMPGMGLGLPIAKTIAEIHNGYLKAENIPNGVRFSLFLPL